MAYRQPLPQDEVPAGASNDFVQSAAPEPHRARTKDLLRRHPEIRALIGPSQRTFWYTLGIVLLQFGVAWFAASRSWWLIVALAYTVGAFASHALFVAIHECAHRLVFRRKLPNILTGLMANLPLFTPGRGLFPEVSPQASCLPGGLRARCRRAQPLGGATDRALPGRQRRCGSCSIRCFRWCGRFGSRKSRFSTGGPCSIWRFRSG